MPWPAIAVVTTWVGSRPGYDKGGPDATTVESLTDLNDHPKLLLAIEPRTINSGAQAEKYREAIDVLANRPRMSDGQRGMVGLLAQLVYH